MINLLINGRGAVIIMLLLLLSILSCSRVPDNDASEMDDNSVSPAVMPVAEALPAESSDQVSFETLFSVEMKALQEYQDRDGDGIHDDVDVYPDTAPSFRSATSGQLLSIETVWTEIDGHRVSGIAIEEQTLNIRGAGFSEMKSNPDSWLVFMTENGFRAIQANLKVDGSLSVIPPQGAVSVHLVIGLSRSIEVPLDFKLGSAPVLYDSDQFFVSGSAITLKGRNLQKASTAILGTNALEVIDITENTVTVLLPQRPTNNRLRLSVGKVLSNIVALDIRHDVHMSIAPELSLKTGEQLSLWYAGKRYRFTSGRTHTISLPAYRPVVLFFDVVKPSSEIRFHSRVSTVVWPDNDNVQISSVSTLSARLYNMRSTLPGITGKPWKSVRTSLETALATSSALMFFSELNLLLADNVSFPQETRIIDVIAEYRERLNQSSRPRAKFIPTGADLDDVVGATVTYEGEGPDADAPNGGDYVYPRLTAGNDYAQIVIVPHQKSRLVNRDLNFFNTVCNFSSEEQLARPSILWDSDLCVQLDGLVFASVAVYNPGLLGTDKRYQPVSSDRVRRHAIAKTMDSNYMWGQGGHYLKDDKGRALCNMETCYVELITSGYGAGYKVMLNDSQKELVETLRLRMWLEGILPAMLHLVGVASGESAVGAQLDAEACLYKKVMGGDEIYLALEKLQKLIKDNANKTGTALVAALIDAVDETLGKWARGYVMSEFGSDFFNCVKPAVDPLKLAGDAFSNMINKGLTLDNTGLFKFADVLALVSDLGSVVLTPEKVVFRMDPRARIIGIAPEHFDLYDLEKQAESVLDILGTWLAEKPCDAAEGWCPKIVFRDRFGKEYIYQTKDSQMLAVPSGSGYAYTRLSIPFSEIIIGLNNLSSGPIEMKLTVSDGYVYHTYIDAKFAPDSYRKLPIPLVPGILSLTTKTKLIAFDPPLAKPDEKVAVIGNNLGSYGPAAIFELSNTATGEYFSLETAGLSADPDLSVNLKLPPVMSTGLYRLTIKPDPAGINAHLPQITSTSVLAITADQSWPAVVVGDIGQVKDDSLVIELLDDTGEPVRNAAESLAPLRFVIPTELRKPAGRYVDGYYWDDSSTSLTAIVKRVKVTCTDSGGDDICTYGIRMLRDQLCLSSWASPRSSFLGNILEGESHIFDVALEIDQITDCRNMAQ